MPRLRQLLAAALILLAGCAHLATRQEKEASFKPFATKTIGSIDLRDFIEERTGVLIAGAQPVAVESRGKDVGVRLKPVNKDGKVDIGSAAAVAADGYFLTAAHCVTRQPMFMLVPTPTGPQAFPARLVWTPATASLDADLAVVKVKASVPAAFQLAEDAEVFTGDPVVTTGANGEAAGKLIRAQRSPADPAINLPSILTLIHNAPLTHGDSGGPLTTLDGKLIGVQVQVRGMFLGPRESVALRPDPVWLDELIRRDRIAHPETRRHSGHAD